MAHHKRRSKSRRLRLLPKTLEPWYVPLVAKLVTPAERREALREAEQRAELTDRP